MPDSSELPWLAGLDEDDQAHFFGELHVAAEIAATGDLVPFETCLREWRKTAEALADPQRRQALIGPGGDEYVEVPRP